MIVRMTLILMCAVSSRLNATPQTITLVCAVELSLFGLFTARVELGLDI